MPVYEFICRKCEKPFEITKPISQAPLVGVKCPACGSRKVERTYSQIYAVTSKKS